MPDARFDPVDGATPVGAEDGQWRRLFGKPDLPLVQDHVFDTLPELFKAFPDLEALAEAPIYKLEEHETVVGYRVTRQFLGAGAIGGHDWAAACMVIRTAEDPTTEKLVLISRGARREAANWQDMERLLGSDTAPAFEPASAMKSLRQAAAWANPASQWLAAVNARKNSPESPDLSEDVRTLLDQAWIAIEHAYRAGRFMREAELGRHDAAIATGKKARQDRSAGAREGNKVRRKKADARRATVRAWAIDMLKRPDGPSGKGWDHSSLATAVIEAWEKVDERPKHSTVVSDLKTLKLPG